MNLAPVAGLCLALFAAGLPLEAHSAEPRLRIGIFGSGKGSGPLLTRAELRECLSLQERIRSGNELATRDREVLEKDKGELVAQGNELRAQLEALDRTSAEAIEQHVARAAARDKAIDAFELRSAAFNARVAALNGERASFQQRCDNRRFDELDETAIRNGK